MFIDIQMSMVFLTSKTHKDMVKNEMDLRVKCLRLNNDGEYGSKFFSDHYTENETKMSKQFTRHLRRTATQRESAKYWTNGLRSCDFM